MLSRYRIVAGHIDARALRVAVEGLHNRVRVGNTKKVEDS